LQPHDQRLNFDQNRARALHRREDRAACNGVLPARQEQQRGIAHFGQAMAFHGKHANLIDRAKAVLQIAQDAVLMTAFSLEGHHHIDHMLQHARAAMLPSLVTWPTSTSAAPFSLA
jgi:hypothetical protein